MSEILPLLTDENAKRIAEDIVLAIEEEGDKQTIDFDFNVKEGRMERAEIENEEIREVLRAIHGGPVPAPNTWFSFDTRKNSMLGFLKDTVCRKMDEDTMTDKEFMGIKEFIPKILKTFNSDQKLMKRTRDALRRIVLDHKDDDFFPIKEMKVLLFEFGAKEDYGDMIKVFNYGRMSVATGQYTSEKGQVSKDLIKRRREAGYNRGESARAVYDRIIAEQKAAGNPIYAEVMPEDVEIVSEAKECHLDLFADYSPLSKEEILAKVTQPKASSD